MTDILKSYLEARQKLQQEKTQLQSRLREINGVLHGVPLSKANEPVARPTKPKGRKMSAAARARIAAAAKARWAKVKAAEPESAKPKRRKMSAAARAKLAAAARARWAKVKAAGMRRL